MANKKRKGDQVEDIYKEREGETQRWTNTNMKIKAQTKTKAKTKAKAKMLTGEKPQGLEHQHESSFEQ